MSGLEIDEMTIGPEALERIAHLTREEVDALPYGLMLFDAAGTVHLYNRYESRLSRRSPAQVLGRNWFSEVAPCTRVAAFEGRFREFVARAERSEVLRFEFRFHFLHGAQDVEVTFAHAPEPGRIFVIVTRRALDESGRPLDVTADLRIDGDGRARGGLGAALPIPRIFLAAAFDDDRPAAVEILETGAAAWGKALVEGIESYCERVHQRPFVQLPALLAVSILDDVFRGQGLGRIEVDFGGAARGILGFALRTADLPVAVAEILYAGVLGEIARAISGRPLIVVPFARHGEIVRFAAATVEKAQVIRRWRDEGIPAQPLARRLGLEVW
jgi:photoactive yellow protein